MWTTNCKVCGKEVPFGATICPHCRGREPSIPPKCAEGRPSVRDSEEVIGKIVAGLGALRAKWFHYCVETIDKQFCQGAHSHRIKNKSLSGDAELATKV